MSSYRMTVLLTDEFYCLASAAALLLSPGKKQVTGVTIKTDFVKLFYKFISEKVSKISFYRHSCHYMYLDLKEGDD